MISRADAVTRAAPRLVAATLGLTAAWIAFDLFVWAYGESPRALLGLAFEGTWGSAYGIGQVLFKATPLLFTGVAVDLALRAGLFNIGAEGQLAVASLAAAVVGAALPAGVPIGVGAVVAMAAAAAAGALWALVPALLRARLGAHEVISTIMMNRIAEAFVALLLRAGLARPGTVRTDTIAGGARLARLGELFPALAGSAVSVAAPMAVAVALVVGWSHGRTRLGREIDLVGKNPIACAREKIPVAARLGQALLLSGAIAGLASSATVLGYKRYDEAGLGAGAGFGGLAVALLAQRSVVGLVLAALLFGTLAQAGLAINAHVPMELMDVLQAVVICAVAASDASLRAHVLRGVGVGVAPRKAAA